jgi:predicted permease
MRWQRKKDRRLNAELQFHVDRLIEDYLAAGIEPGEARRRAHLEFGGIDQIEEACRDVRGRWLEDLGKDLRYALRVLWRSPAFFAVAVLSLALGIGANSAIFSLINAVMLRPLPVRAPGRLVRIARLTPAGNPGAVSYPLFEYFRDNLTSASGAFAEMSSSPGIVVDGVEDQVTAEWVSGAHFVTLGVDAAAGRLLGAADDMVTSVAPAAVISYGYWQQRFGLDPAAVGKPFAIGDRVFTIVGVTARSFHGTRPGRDPDVTLPLLAMLSDEQRHEVSGNVLDMMARLPSGGTEQQTDAELQVLWQRFVDAAAARASEKDRPAALRQRAGVFAAPDGLNPLRYRYRDALLILMSITGLVLLLACANLSGLLLARAAARQREISIRLAIGAGRGRLLRQFLAEGLVLASIGGAAGLLLAGWFSGRLVAMLANGGTLAISATPDWRVLVFTAAVSVLSCLLVGLAPGLHAVNANLNPALKAVRTGSLRRFGNALVIAQLSISMVLLVGATLFVGTLVKLHRVDRGLRTDGVVMFGVRANRTYPPARGLAVQTTLLDRVSDLPGVTSASAAQVVPISGGLWIRPVKVEGYAFRPDESESIGFNVVAPGYFRTLGTPMVAGREFDDRDTDRSTRVAVVNESFVRYFFGRQSPVGLPVASLDVVYEIVGVAKDAKYQSLRDEVMKTMYIPWLQREGDQPSRYSYLARVASGDPMQVAPALDRLVRGVDPDLRVRSVRTYSSVVDQSIVTERIMATLGGFFGGLALAVAGLGMFGLMAFQMSCRTNEFGVRMALGAGRRRIVAIVFRDVALMSLAGAVAGGVLALSLTGLTSKILFGITPTEPAVFALAAAVLAAAALAAGWIPARRASLVDPIAALRHE